jgi:hypothetical protein
LSQTINVNGVTIQYPETGDTGWGDEATDFAIQTSAAFSALGLSTGTSVDIPGTLDVTGATTLDSTLDVTGNTDLTGNLDVSGDTNLTGDLDVLGNTDLNGTLDVALAAIFASTVTIVDDLAVDTDTLFVDVSADRVGINTASPTEALDVIGNIKSSANASIGGTLSVDGNTTLGNASGDSLTINGTTVSVPNGLNIDSGTFVIDATNNRIGINNGSPSVALDLIGVLKLRASSASGYGYTQFGNSSTSTQNWHAGSEGDGNFKIYNGNVGTGVNALQIANNGQLSAVVPGGSTLYNGYLCRAWVMLNGTGTAALVASGNVSTITDHGTGQYTITFANPMPDANYSVVATVRRSDDSTTVPYVCGYLLPTTTNVRFVCTSVNLTLFDVFLSMGIFR